MREEACLSELVTIRRGTTYKSSLLGLPGPVLLGLASIARNGGFRSDNLKTYGGESPESLLVQPGQLFASLKDVTQSADLLGSVARVPSGSVAGRLTQDTVRIDVVSDRIYPDFLYLSLLTPKYRDYCRRHATGTTTLGLQREDFLAYKIWLPPLDEQRRIAGVLGSLDDLIEVNRGLVRDLRDLALARYAEVMALTKETCRLGDLVTVNGSQIKPAAAGTLTYLDIASVGDGTVQWPTPMPWANAPSRARRLATAGSTIWSTVRPNRRAHALLTHVPDDLVVSTGFAVLEPKVIGSAEIFCATNGDDFVDYLMSRADGSAYPAVRGSVFEDAVIPYFGAETSAQFENFAWPLLLAAGELVEESRQLAATRDELLPLLMSGRVRVREDGVAA